MAPANKLAIAALLIACCTGTALADAWPNGKVIVTNLSGQKLYKKFYSTYQVDFSNAPDSVEAGASFTFNYRAALKGNCAETWGFQWGASSIDPTDAMELWYGTQDDRLHYTIRLEGDTNFMRGRVNAADWTLAPLSKDRACVNGDVADMALTLSGLAAPVETAPVETAPVETAPAETAPVETAPVETAPVETAPAETAPAETAPAEAAPAETAPTETAPAETAPADAAQRTNLGGNRKLLGLP